MVKKKVTGASTVIGVKFFLLVLREVCYVQQVRAWRAGWLSVTALSLGGSNPEQLLFKLFLRLNALYAGVKYFMQDRPSLLTGVNKAMLKCWVWVL